MKNSSLKTVAIKDLKVSFRSRKKERVQALKGISFDLYQGETLSIVGESGSGKTTLLRCLTGLEVPSGGSVRILETDPFSCSGAELLALRQKCGYIPQDPYGCLPPTLGVREAVMEPYLIVEGRKTMKEARLKAEDLLGELGLTGEKLWTSRIRTTLSGGQRQRVSVARSLVLDPLLLLADEPTSMQDVSTRGEILEILKERVTGGMSMIFVTHDLFLARTAAVRTMVLYNGFLCEYGNSEEILENPLHPYTKALYAALPRLGGTIHTPEGVDNSNQKVISGCPYMKTCPEADEKCSTPPPMVDMAGRKVACWRYMR